MIDLVRLPGLMFFYTAGVAAVAAQRTDLVGRLFNDVTVRYLGRPARPSQQLSPRNVYELSAPSNRLHHVLAPIFTRQLNLGMEEFIDHWETFELVGQADVAFTASAPEPFDDYVDAMVTVETLTEEVEQLKGTNYVDALETAQAAQRSALHTATAVFNSLKQQVWLPPLHIRIQDGFDFSRHAETGQRLVEQLRVQRQLHWLTVTGLFDGRWEIAWAVIAVVSAAAGDQTRRGNLTYYWMDTGDSAAG